MHTVQDCCRWNVKDRIRAYNSAAKLGGPAAAHAAIARIAAMLGANQQVQA